MGGKNTRKSSKKTQGKPISTSLEDAHVKAAVSKHLSGEDLLPQEIREENRTLYVQASESGGPQLKLIFKGQTCLQHPPVIRCAVKCGGVWSRLPCSPCRNAPGIAATSHFQSPRGGDRSCATASPTLWVAMRPRFSPSAYPGSYYSARHP